MRHCIVNLGCKVNRVEADGLERALRACGSLASEARFADLIVVNTCTVTAEADKKARKAVRQALRANPRAHVLATGCAAALQPGAFEALGSRVEVVPKAQAADAVRRVAREAGAQGRPEAGLPFPLPNGRTRVGIKVQDGCDHACTYCIVHVARGPATSTPADAVVAEAVELASSGVREVVLTGINLGSYRSGATDLAALLRLLLDATEPLHRPGQPPCRFRLSSVEPNDVTDGLIDVLASAEGRVCRHLHLPLQSGSSRVLREMGRPYDAAGFRALVGRLRARIPGIALATDVIAGFPGEAEADFQQTCALVADCAFMNVHVFPYSERTGTPAAARADQVPPSERAQRAERLRALAADLRAADLTRRTGTTELALVEEQGRAMLESYHEVTAPADAPIGALVPITLG